MKPAGAWGSGPPVVAMGGGHGLAASLRALRRVTDRVTAVVGVSDDGGSSGRIRRELGLMPPGDLRKALEALCGDDTWGRTWSRVMQHRFDSEGELAGHAVGNILISALWQETGDVVDGLDWVGALLEAQGRVLPVVLEPLELVAEVIGIEGPGVITPLRGQTDIATTAGEVVSLRIEPKDPQPCEQVLAAIAQAQMIVLGPGSWFTSVLPHLYVGPVHDAVVASTAKRVLVINVKPEMGETTGFTASRYLENLADAFDRIRLDWVIVDSAAVDDEGQLQQACERLGAQPVIEEVRAAGDRGPKPGHDSLLLASVFQRLLNGQS